MQPAAVDIANYVHRACTKFNRVMRKCCCNSPLRIEDLRKFHVPTIHTRELRLQTITLTVFEKNEKSFEQLN